MPASRVRVLIADDHPLYREGLARAVSSRPDLELVAESGDGRDALEQIRSLKPDVAVLDLHMPGLEGIDIAEAVGRDQLPTRVLMLSAAMESALVYGAGAAGAAAYVTKAASRDEILAATSRAAGPHGLEG